jgi:hypothetical protein
LQAFVRGQSWLLSGSPWARLALAGGYGANSVDNATLWLLAALGDCDAVGEWTALQQLGALDGPLPFGDVLAAGGLLLPGWHRLNISEEGGIANSIIGGIVSKADARRLARYIQQRHGTTTMFGSRFNDFDASTNTISLRHPRNAVPRGVFYEEIQHALDYHVGLYEGLLPIPVEGTSYHDAFNNRIHIIAFRNMAGNKLGWFELTQEQIEALLKRADEWERNLPPLPPGS